MSIPQAVPSVVPQVIYYVGSQLSLDKVSAGYSILEGAFYSMLRAGNLQASRVVKQIQETCVAQIHNIQMLFNIVNVGIVFVYAKKFVDEVQGRYSFSMIDFFAAKTLDFLPVAAVAGIAFAVGIIIHRRYKKEETSVIMQEDVTRQRVMVTQQSVARVLHIAKLVINTALICFAKNRIWFVLSLWGTIYSCIKNANLKWLRFSKTTPLYEEPPYSYNVLVLPSKTAISEQLCCICENAESDMVFCNYHAFCQKCINEVVAKILGDSDSFLSKINYKRFIYCNRNIRSLSYSYTVTLPQESLPSCPMCRRVPLQNTFDCKVYDRNRAGQFAATVIIKPSEEVSSKQSLFEKLYALYNVGQAGISYLQKYPELAAMIFKIQKVLLVTDLCGYALTVYYLYENVIEKFKIKVNDHKKRKIVAAVIVAIGVTIAALSYLAILQINAYLRPTIILRDLLVQVGVSKEILKDSEVSWVSSPMHCFMQLLLVNRIIATIALTFFSNQKKINLLNIIAQVFSLWRISLLRWIKWTQILQWPLNQIVKNGGTLFHVSEMDLKSLKVTSYFMVDPSCTKDTMHLQSVVKSIYSYISRMFDKSVWDRFWEIIYQNGIEVSRSLFYKVILQNNPIPPCECSLTPLLTDLFMKAVDAVYGNANVQILTNCL